MKLLKITIALIFLNGLWANAQTTINIGTTAETPVVRYYYLPEAEAYYDANDKTYIYLKNGKWGHWKNLPPGQAKKVRWIKLSDYRGDTPYVDIERHKVLYVKPKTVVVATKSNTVAVKSSGKVKAKRVHVTKK
ncbi:hypothetical protein [Flavobacterium pallidum]|uniref:Uncharacterized protein n=1 Tax=Flavobacterium pallidum TaxID=2172098 RepID=A0A2S1SK00_9FLAO|nr:hypothetical protein [Flavobacterium pallidum]AWI26657.1 hypothetical protein HYN49_12535 [Flavobacterium pallidum]